MKLNVEFEERDVDDREDENEDTEYVSDVTFMECSRKDLEELGKFFLTASKALPTPRLGPRDIRVSQMYLKEFSEHFKDHETMICVSLAIDEP